MTDKFSIIPLQFDALKDSDIWGHIRRDILTAARRTGEPFRPVDVLRLAKAGKVFVAQLVYDGVHIGSLVLRPLTEEFSDTLILHVWILTLDQTNCGESDLLDQVWDFVLEQALLARCDKIQVISNRRGWRRRLARYGFEESPQRAYLREVTTDGEK